MRRTCIAGALVVAASLVTTACGSPAQKVTGTITPDARAALQAAAAKTASADSARMGLSFGVQASGMPGEAPMNFEVTGTGLIGFASKDGDFTLDTSGVPKEAGSDPLPAKLHVVVVDGTAYIEIPAEYASKAPAGKTWAKLSPEDSEGIFGLGLGGASSMPGMPDFTDPAKALESLQGLGDTKAVGTEELRGTKTTHYVTEVSMAKAFQESAGAGSTTTSAEPNPFAGMFAGLTFPVDAWVGDDGLLRKVRIEMDLGKLLGPLMSGLAGAFGATTTPSVATDPFEFKISMAIELYDYGTAVHVAAPPADQVVDAAQIKGLTGD